MEQSMRIAWSLGEESTLEMLDVVEADIIRSYEIRFVERARV